MKRLYSHILIPLLILAITATTLVFTGSKPASALLGVGDVTATIETVSIPQIFFNSIIKAVEAAGYTVLRKAMRQALSNLTKSTLNNLLEGGKGKGEAFETEPWDQFWQQAGDEAAGSALEGFVQGFQNEYEAQSKKAAALKNLEDKETANLQPQIENASVLRDDLEACGMQNVATGGDNSPQCATEKAAADKAEADLKKNTDNTFTAQKRDLLVRRTSIEKAITEFRKTYDECVKAERVDNPRGPISTCSTQENALKAKETELDTNQKSLNDALAGADKATAEELKKIDKAANKKDADLIAGNTGALTAVSKTLIDIVCKPTPDIALGFFLPLGDKIEQTKRKPLCPYSKIKENWQEIYNNTGTRLDEASLGGWRTIAGLVNPNTSDLAAAYSVSIAGHSVSDVAQALGVTQYMGTDAAGGLKKVTEFNGKITTPITTLKTVTENAIVSGVQEDTRLVPTGHLLADLVITAGSTVLNTAFDIFKEGLKKKTAAVRQPKANKGIAALSQFQQNNALYFPNADPNAGSHQFAEARLARFDALELSPAQNFDVLNKITGVGSSPTCYNPTGSDEQKATDVESCTIDEKFNEAVSKGLTVQEAVDQGLLNGDGIFGFDIRSSDPKTEPSFQRNFPYHSLVILRKYRVIPVSWELAALYIKELKSRNIAPCGGSDSNTKNCTLKILMEQFDKQGEKFYQMIDPNWVLMVPPTKCMLEGYGPQSIHEVETEYCDGPVSVVGGQSSCPGGMKKRIDIVRAKTCVDYQTCLQQDAAGHCTDKGYGYCLEEQRTAVFTGKECKPANEGCQIFQDTQTKQSVPYLKLSLEKNADLGNGKCTADNAGCRWLSATRQLQDAGGTNVGKVALTADKQAKTKVASVNDVNTQQEWSSSTADRVYLASKAEKCQPEAEGCREVSGVSGMSYLRLPPSSYECDKDGVDPYGNVIPWYKRAECKQFTAVCKQQFVGCEQYTPSNDTFFVTGVSPDDSAATTNPYQYRCPAQCAGIKNFTVEKTLFDTVQPPTENFSADTATKCSISDVGCEEFTNVNVAAAGGEGKEYYTFMQQCIQKEAENVPAKEVFLSFIGTEQAGGQPVKYYVVGDNDTDSTNTDPDPTVDGFNFDTWQPKCADSTKPCDCTVADATKNMNDPRVGTVLCREFINSSGKSFYRYTDNLIYYGTDCTAFRRTLDGETATDTLYSQSLSKRCSAPSAVNCREYHAPTAGNIRVLYPEGYSNFEDGTAGDWSTVADAGAAASTVTPTGDGEILGDHSLKVHFSDPAATETKTTLSIEKNIGFSQDKSYTITFNAKGTTDATASVLFVPATGAEVALTGDTTLKLSATQWKRFSFLAASPAASYDTLKIRVTGTAPVDFTIDDIVVKEIEGIEYVIKDSWEKNGMCFSKTSDTDPTPNFNSIAYPNCSLYSDRQGGQHAIQKFEKICPLEMAGCQEAVVNNEVSFNKLFDFESGVAPFTSIVGSCTKLEKVTNEKNGGTASAKVTLLGSIAAKGTTAGSSDCAVSGWSTLNPNHYYGIVTYIDTGSPLGGRTFTGSVWVKAGQGRRVTLLMHDAARTPDDWAGDTVKSSTITTDGSWQQISVAWSIPTSHAVSTIQLRLSNEQQGASGDELYWDDARLQETGKGKIAYIIPDPAKQCSAQDNKCTAYGSPKLLTKTDGSERLKIIRNPAQDTTRSEWKEKEDWNIAYYKVTAEESVVAQTQFKNGDTSGYDRGICRAATYSGTAPTPPILPQATNKGDLGCREYLAGSGGDLAYFRDPGNSVCQSPKEGQSRGYYYTCNNDDTVVCRKDDDCPVKNDTPGKCNTQKELQDQCPFLPDVVDSAGSYNTGVCSNNKNKACNAINVTAVCGTGSPTPTCLSTPFVQRCPSDSAGCRKIVDPECGSDGKLRTDYGRGISGSGIACKREYYFTDDLQERAAECERAGGVNVNAGCLLFNDASKEKWEYRIVETTTTPITPISVNPIDDAFKTTPPTYCACDVSATREDDCASTHDASSLDPRYCYNRYTQIAANTGPLLRKYERFRTDTIYNSKALYNCAEASGAGKTDLTKSIDLTKCSTTVQGGGVNDANTLIKVKPDRSCKTWLACKAYYYSNGEQICTERIPCNKANEDGTCADNPAGDALFLKGVIEDTSANDAANRKLLLSLSGYARPDYWFKYKIPTQTQPLVTSGGHDSYFDKWRAYILPSPSPLAFNKIISVNLDASTVAKSNQITDAPYRNFCTIDTTKACNSDADCAAGQGVCGPGYLRSCRLYPQQNSPRSGAEIINACQAQGGSNGIEGYCIEPNPRFKDEYLLSSPKYPTCSKDYSEPHNTCSVNEGLRAYRYYENFCLNWLPIRPGINQSYIAGSADNYDNSSLGGPLYACVDTETYDKNDAVQDKTATDASDHTLPASLAGPYSMEAKAGDPGSLCLVGCTNPPLFQKGTIDINGATGLPSEAIAGVQIRFDSSKPTNVTNDWLTSEIVNDVVGNSFYNAYYIAYNPDSENTFNGACPNGWAGHGGVTETCYASIQSGGGGPGGPPSYTEVPVGCNDTRFFVSRRECAYKLTDDFLRYLAGPGVNSDTLFTDGSSSICRDGISYVIFKTDIGPSDKLTGARWAACNKKDVLGSDNQIKSFKVDIDVDLNTYKESSITTQTERKYDRCTKFVKVINFPDNAQVPVQTHPISGTPFLKQLVAESLSGEVRLGDRFRQHTVITYPDWVNTLVGNKNEDKYDTPTGAYTEGATVYPIKKVDVNENVQTNNTNNIKYYFAKPYAFSIWSGGSYAENSDISAATSDISGWWNDAKSFAKTGGTGLSDKDGNRPRIYGRDSSMPNRFIFSPAGDNGVVVSFFAHVKDEQLPLRSWEVYKVDSGGNKIGNSQGESRPTEGIGLKDKEAPATASDPNKPFGPVYYEYDKIGNVQPLNNKTLCVEVKDNWEACTRTCGRIVQVAGSQAAIPAANFSTVDCSP